MDSRCEELKPTLWQTLCKLAELGAVEGTISVSTSNIAESLGVSQQTVSRHFIELERQGLITRQPLPNGMEIKITEGGAKELRQTYLTLKRTFEEHRPRTVSLTGRVFTGIGEGAYYVDKTDYGKRLQNALGFKPYPGTLNLRLLPSQAAKKKELEAHPGITIKGFEMGGRSFGGVKCFPATIDGIEGAVILIGRTHYDASVVELIAPIQLRSRLKLRDGSKVRVLVRLEGTVTRTTSPKWSAPPPS